MGETRRGELTERQGERRFWIDRKVWGRQRREVLKKQRLWGDREKGGP